MNTAMRDQLAAARRNARRIIDQAATLAPSFEKVDAVPGPFVQSLLRDIRRSDKRGRLRRCRHLAGRGPAPSWVLAWRPERAFCDRCARDELLKVQGTAEDATCDVCRERVPRIWSAVGAAGAVLISYGACRTCFEAETGRVAA